MKGRVVAGRVVAGDGSGANQVVKPGHPGRGMMHAAGMHQIKEGQGGMEQGWSRTNQGAFL